MIKDYRYKAQGLSDLLSYAAIIAEGICLLKDGSLCAGFSYRGKDLDGSDSKTYEALSANVSQTLCQLGDGWMMHVDLIRHPSAQYPAAENNHFPDATSRLIDEERRVHYLSEEAHYESRYVLVITYQTPSENEVKMQKWLYQNEESQHRTTTDKTIQYFKDQIEKFSNTLANDLKIEMFSSGQLLQHVHFCITGLDHAIKMPQIPVYLDTMLATQDFIAGLSPKIGKHHIKVIHITGLPLESEPGMLRFFETLAISFRWSNRFIFLDANSAHQALAQYRRNWFQKRHGLMGILREIFHANGQSGFQNQDALDMTQDADEAIREADSNLVRFGYYTSVVVLMDEDLHYLETVTKFVLKQLAASGFTGREESINAVEAYLGSLPGHGVHNVRKPLVHSLNLTDLLPLTSIWPGLLSNPCPYYPSNSPSLLTAATTGNTPFRLNLHVQDVAHTFIKGATGSGKSTLVLMLIAQFFRYREAQVFLFDKGYSAYPLCQAMQGNHYNLAYDNQALSFYPLQHIDKPGELEWASDWIESCLMCQGYSINPDIRTEIRSSLLRLAQQPKSKRTLTDYQATVQSESIRKGLAYYTLGGTLGRLLDSDQDCLQSANFQVFEMQHLFQMGEVATRPILNYLFHQIDKRLIKGRPSLIVIEEGHTFLHGQFGQQLELWLLEKRKQNTGVIFIDQSLAKIFQSPFAHTLMDSCKTKIFLPDLDADTALNATLYHQAGLTEGELQIIKSAKPKQHYYYHSALGKRLFDLALGPVALSFVGVDGEEGRTIIDELISKYHEEWVYHWLKLRGCESAAAQWLNDRKAIITG